MYEQALSSKVLLVPPMGAVVAEAVVPWFPHKKTRTLPESLHSSYTETLIANFACAALRALLFLHLSCT